MPENGAEVRLALLEQSMEKMMGMVEALSTDVRRVVSISSEMMVLRADATRTSQDLQNIRSEHSRNCEGLNQRIDRTQALIGDIDRKHEGTMRKMWFWHGVAWGAGALVAITMGLTVYVANDALDTIKLLRADLHKLEVQMQGAAKK